MSWRMRLANRLITAEARRNIGREKLDEARAEADYWYRARQQMKRQNALLDRHLETLRPSHDRMAELILESGYVHGLDPADDDPRKNALG